MEKIKAAWATLDGKLPRMWKEWLITALIVWVIYHYFLGGEIRAQVLLSKIPLLTLGGILGYYGDRGLFPYARPADILKSWGLNTGLFSGTDALRAFNTACIRRAIIVAACVLGAALAA